MPLSPLSSLLQRNLALLKGGSLFVLQSPDKGARDILRESLPKGKPHFHHFDFAAHLQQRDDSSNWHFGPWISPKAAHQDQALGFRTRGRALMEMSSMMAAQTLKPGASLILLGMKKEGMASLESWLEDSLGPILHRDAARHGILYQIQLEKKPPAVSLESWAAPYEVHLKGRALQICSFPGVFSQGHLDPGTDLLLGCLEKLPSPPTVLDLGCGAGVLGLAARILWPEASVDVVDSNALALESTRRTFEANALNFRALRASDLFSEVPESYDLILCNPPFHEGPYRDFSFVDRLLRDAGSHLNPGGRLVLVSNRMLPYAKRISSVFPTVQILAENSSYRVYSAGSP